MKELAWLTVVISILLMLWGGWPVKIEAAPVNSEEIGTEWMTSRIRKTSFADGVDCYEVPNTGYGGLSCVRRVP